MNNPFDHTTLNRLARRIQLGFDVQGSDTTEIVRLTRDRCVSLANRILADHFDAEDAVQNAYMKIFLNISLWRETQGNFYSYLCMYVVREAQRIKRDRYTLTGQTLGPGYETDQILMQQVRSVENFEEDIIRLETLQRLESFLETLPRAYRLVWLLNNYEDYNFIEISRITKIPYDTCRVYGSRTWKLIRRYFEE